MIPAIIGAVGSVVGGAIARGGGLSATQQIANSLESQRAMKRDDTAIQRRVADARAAGIHPLAALGANVNSGSWQPVYQSGSSGSGVAESLFAAGQDLTRAYAASQSPEAKNASVMGALQIENQSLQNDLLRSQLSRLNQSPVVGLPSNSGMPLLTGQGNSYATSGGYVVENPAITTHTMPGNPAQEVGKVADYGYVQTPTGLAIVPSKDVKEKIEDQLIPETMWALRNQIMPNFGAGPRPPDPKYFPLPKGYDRWKWSMTAQEFRPHKDGTWDRMYKEAERYRGSNFADWR